MDFENSKFYTNRLNIRPLNTSDYNSWYLGFSKRQKSKYKYDQGYIDLSDTNEEWFSNLVKKHKELFEKDDTYIFAIFNKKGEHLGMLDIVTIKRENFQWGECGFFIHNQVWNNGYAYEALTKIIEVANKELGFHRLEAHVNVDNDPSIKLLEKLGFEYECTRKGFIYEFGEWTDNYVYFINLHNRSC